MCVLHSSATCTSSPFTSTTAFKFLIGPAKTGISPLEQGSPLIARSEMQPLTLHQKNSSRMCVDAWRKSELIKHNSFYFLLCSRPKRSTPICFKEEREKFWIRLRWGWNPPLHQVEIIIFKDVRVVFTRQRVLLKKQCTKKRVQTLSRECRNSWGRRKQIVCELTYGYH